MDVFNVDKQPQPLRYLSNAVVIGRSENRRPPPDKPQTTTGCGK